MKQTTIVIPTPALFAGVGIFVVLVGVRVQALQRFQVSTKSKSVETWNDAAY